MKRLCIALLCLLIAGLLGCGQAVPEETSVATTTQAATTTEPPTAPWVEPLLEKIPSASITKIDLSAPESQIYRDWLKAYSASSTWPQPIEWISWEGLKWATEREVTNAKQPDADAPTREEIETWGLEYDVIERWRTLDWNDIWELEMYGYSKSGRDKQVLRMRDKATGKTRIIYEIRNFSGDSDHYGVLRAVSVDEAYVVYCTGGIEGTKSFYLYSLRQGKAQYIGNDHHYAGFLDAERTKWWHQEYNSGLRTLYYTDLRKLAAGDADAEREVTRGYELHVSDGWIAKRDGRDVMCFRVATYYPDPEGSTGWNGPHYIWIYDLLDGSIKKFMELPQLTAWHRLYVAELVSNVCFYFDSWLTITDSDWINDIDLGDIDFYIIKL